MPRHLISKLRGWIRTKRDGRVTLTLLCLFCVCSAVSDPGEEIRCFEKDRILAKAAGYLASMMDEAGGFPAELARTKPYGYSPLALG